MNRFAILFALLLVSLCNAPAQEIGIGPVFPGTPSIDGGTFEFGGPGFFYKGNIYRSHVSAQAAKATDFINGNAPVTFGAGGSYSRSYRSPYLRPFRRPRDYREYKSIYSGYKSIYRGYKSPYLK